MSSRAIRKLQKLREQEAQRVEEDDSDDEPVARPKINAFDLLNAGGEEEDYQEEDEEEEAKPEPEPEQVSDNVPEPVTRSTEGGKSAQSKKKKGKKKKNKKAASKPEEAASTGKMGKKGKKMDDVDRALRGLAVGGDAARGSASAGTAGGRDDGFSKTPETLLAIEPRALNATNEMRKLFGNVVLENFDQEDAGTGRRRDRARETIDLGRALTGRYSPASRGQSLAGVTLRRNALMQGKDEWPRTPSGGLGMELVEKTEAGPTVYRIVHNSAYKDVQRQFEMCVESMDPQRMIQLLQYNPYHISTLLQVSEISKHQGDHAVSADLLERALFNIGRSAHSSFNTRLKEGNAKLDFMHMENRELWLVGWRYIANLGMKGTWRTAYEWAKLLLSLSDSDPYCIRLLIDHLALRGREYSHFIELCTQTRLSKEWDALPNIQCSLALAYLRLNKPKECREQLRLAMSRYPWVFCKLAQELDIQPMPKRIWGKMPPTEAHELLTELYIVRAKDLWNTPEVVSLVVEVADTLEEGEKPVEPPEITLDIARHVVLSDNPKVTTHLPSRFVSGRISSSDPLPPYESEAFRQQSDPTPSYLANMPEAGRPQWLRDLLDQLNNGGIHFPRFGQGDGDGEEGQDNDLLSEGEDETDGTHNALPHPSADQQPLLKQWLVADGMHALQAFLRQYGVDRGNWGEVVDYSPLTEYVDALDALQPDTRQELLHGAIRDTVGDMVISMLEDELQLLEYDEDEEA
ncbi:transcriptional repressor TCF25-domain-containing protein [Aspergillus avenaceus]|uniref:Transcriptional repressor TCF25-domain-containing protein n=1 Tax=Aspergillus avenaceus TaxID=36643 RepID=A0A5N6TP81_ASPAV|nr:transcriptional repressor TCF25-domain-containing protein [Aspergillus avenaceus]